MTSSEKKVKIIFKFKTITKLRIIVQGRLTTQIFPSSLVNPTRY